MAKNKKDSRIIQKNIDALIGELLGDDTCAARNYLSEAITIGVTSDKITPDSKEILTQVGRTNGITKKSVGTAINKYLKQSWSNDGAELRYLIFGNTVNFRLSRPTATKFITAVIYYVKAVGFPDTV